jgi:hypothetical protein
MGDTKHAIERATTFEWAFLHAPNDPPTVLESLNSPLPASLPTTINFSVRMSVISAQ